MKVVPEITKESVTNLINDGERADGRALNEYREISVEKGIITKAEGSAKVKIGNSQVIAGIKYQIGEPFPDTPNVGVIMTNAELIPMASPEFESGPPNENSIELARVVDRAIRESEMVDLEKLCIVKGKKVLMVFIDLHIIDYDGNLFDTASLAALAALTDTKLPKITFENDEIVKDEKILEPLPIRDKALLCTFANIGEKMVIDPSLEEEQILSARLCIGFTESGKICAMQKGGDSQLSKENIFEAVKIAEEKSKELLKHLD